MGLITCPDCGKRDVSDRASACPQCGGPIDAGLAARARESREAAQRRRRKWLVGGFLAIVGMVMVADMTAPPSGAQDTAAGATTTAATEGPKTCGRATSLEVGICEADVLRLMGVPVRQSTDVGPGGERRMLVYEGGGNTLRVMLRNGTVTHIGKSW